MADDEKPLGESITAKGLAELEAEVAELEGPERKKMAERIKAVHPAAAIVITSRRDDVRKVYDGLRKADLTVMNMDEEAARLAQRGSRTGRAHPPAKPDRQDAVVWIAAEMVTLAVQVNGKRRSEIRLPPASPEETVREAALAEEAVQRAMAGKPARRVIVVPDKIVNVVV